MKNKNFKPLEGNSVAEKTVNSEVVIDVLDEQYGNMTQSLGTSFNSDDEVAKFLKNFATQVCNMAMINSSAPTFEGSWKKSFANETWEMLKKQEIERFIKKTIKEMRSKLGNKIEYCDLFNYGFSKIASITGLSSRMILHGYHPDLLKLTEDEANEALLRKAILFKEAGANVTAVAVSEKTASSENFITYLVNLIRPCFN